MPPAPSTRLCGSEDLSGGRGAGPLRSINFATCHDGPTLNGLVSHERRLAGFRRAHPDLSAERFHTAAAIAWPGLEGSAPDR